MNIRYICALWAAKSAALLCRILKTRGSSTPGIIALKIYPGYLGEVEKKFNGKVIAVCGTNGKTTTNNLINTAVTKAGYSTACNKVGSNMLSGIVTAFVSKTNLFGKIKADYACLEVDEATLPLMAKHLKADYACITNLFRDQLDRYGDVNSTSLLLKKAFDMFGDFKLILNADDPVTSVFGRDRNAVYYGFGENPAAFVCDKAAKTACPICGEALEYEHLSYGQIGKYSCPKCGYANPRATYVATNISSKDATLSFDINSNPITAQVSGLYNVYNMLMAYGALNQLGIEDKFITDTLCSQKPEPGRMSKFNAYGKDLYVILSKNPTGFNQSVSSVISDKREKNILLALNDMPQDGEDVSWIWDVDFESLYEHNKTSYIICGTRRYDMYLRLKYAGFNESLIKVFDTSKEAVEYMLSENYEAGYALVNFSAMESVYTLLDKAQEKEGKENG